VPERLTAGLLQEPRESRGLFRSTHSY
jgi:hypothetical protein